MSADNDNPLGGISFAQACSIATEVSGMALILDPVLLDALITDAEVALNSGVIDPLLFGVSAPELRMQLDFMRVFRDFRSGIQPFVLQGEGR